MASFLIRTSCMYVQYILYDHLYKKMLSIIHLSQYKKIHCVIYLFCMKIVVPKKAIGIEETDVTVSVF